MMPNTPIPSTGAAGGCQRASTKDRGDWIQTYMGRQFWPLDPDPLEIFIEDIAHSLSNQCRFTGHCHRFYSVAEHSVRAAAIVPEKDKLWGLLHDASEAYLVDLPRPLKRFSKLGDLYREIEANLMAQVCHRFDLTLEQPTSVEHADRVMLVTEKRDLMRLPPEPWEDVGVEPLEARIRPWSSDKAKFEFLTLYWRLTKDKQFSI
jgi:uncharacterized protein